MATVGPDQKIVIKPIVVARDLGTEIEVASGLAPTDRIILNPPEITATAKIVRLSGHTAKTAPTAKTGRAE